MENSIILLQEQVQGHMTIVFRLIQMEHWGISPVEMARQKMENFQHSPMLR